MKALRDIKKNKIQILQDPENLAKQQLATLSEETSIPFKIQNNYRDTWTLQSFLSNSLNQNINLNSPGLQKIEKSKNYYTNSRLTQPKFILSQRKARKSIFILDESKFEQKQKQRQDKVISSYQQKKSLSLTNYILIDKKTNNEQSAKQKKSSKDKFKMQAFRNFLIHRGQKKCSSPSKIFQKNQKDQQLNKKLKDQINLKSPVKKKQQPIESNQFHYKNQYIHFKTTNNFDRKQKIKQIQEFKNVQKYNFLSPSINWSKAPIHNYLKKFVY